jgi:hypothetical protein
MKPYYYVYKYGGNGPRIRHCTLQAATQEAERLAEKEPGSHFEILKCLGFSRTTEANTFWVDGEGPVDLENPSYQYYRDNSFRSRHYRVCAETGTVQWATLMNPEWEVTSYRPVHDWTQVRADELPHHIKP